MVVRRQGCSSNCVVDEEKLNVLGGSIALGTPSQRQVLDGHDHGPVSRTEAGKDYAVLGICAAGMGAAAVMERYKPDEDLITAALAMFSRCCSVAVLLSPGAQGDDRSPVGERCAYGQLIEPRVEAELLRIRRTSENHLEDHLEGHGVALVRRRTSAVSRIGCGVALDKRGRTDRFPALSTGDSHDDPSHLVRRRGGMRGRRNVLFLRADQVETARSQPLAA